MATMLKRETLKNVVVIMDRAVQSKLCYYLFCEYNNKITNQLPRRNYIFILYILDNVRDALWHEKLDVLYKYIITTQSHIHFLHVKHN